MSIRPSSPRRALGISLALTLLMSVATGASATDGASPSPDTPEPVQTSICQIGDEPYLETSVPQASPQAGSNPDLPTFEIGDCLVSPPPASPAATASLSQAVSVRSGEFWFEPAELVIPAAGATTLILANSGISVHNFTVDELGAEIVASRGRSGQTTVMDPPPGAYLFYCSVSGHREAGMVGRLIVQ